MKFTITIGNKTVMTKTVSDSCLHCKLRPKLSFRSMEIIRFPTLMKIHSGRGLVYVKEVETIANKIKITPQIANINSTEDVVLEIKNITSTPLEITDEYLFKLCYYDNLEQLKQDTMPVKKVEYSVDKVVSGGEVMSVEADDEVEYIEDDEVEYIEDDE